MGQTLIIECTHCGGLFLSLYGRKTRTCPYCGKRVNVRKAKVLASAKSAFKSSKLLREIKNKKGFNRK
jgi:DNA-directed RNA polymerase subunit RPC12/RpoP